MRLEGENELQSAVGFCKYSSVETMFFKTWKRVASYQDLTVFEYSSDGSNFMWKGAKSWDYF